MSNNNQILKVAIIIDRACFYSWHLEILDKIKVSHHLILCINNSSKVSNKPPVLWKLFSQLDGTLFKPNPFALAKQDFDSKFQNLESFDYSNDINADNLKDYELDVILNLTESTPPTELGKFAKYGLWFLTPCDIDKVGRKPYGIWEMIEKQPKTVAVLRYLKKDMKYPATIDLSSSCTDMLSYKRTLDSLFWQSHLLVLNNLKLLQGDKGLFNSQLEKHKQVFNNSSVDVLYRPPSNFEILKYTLALYLKKFRQQIKSQFYLSQWAMIFFNNEGHKDPFNLKDYKKILPPKAIFWSDPFLIKENGKYYLFIEELIYKNKLGHLAVMEIDSEGNYTAPQKILVKNYHLSYPFVFKDNGDYYMIPETSGNNDIQLYKATNFPLKWELQETLMTGVVAVDTTIYKENDTYWMFTSQKNHEGASKSAELFVYSSKTLDATDWKPHPLNPVITNVETARPAGAIFKKDHKLYRSSQVCAPYYGYGINIMEIIKLTETDYEEKVELKILPHWDSKISGTHSFNNVDDLYVSDIKINRFRYF